MESESESKGPIGPTHKSLPKPMVSKPPRSKEKTFQIFANAALGLVAIAILLRIIVYIVQFVNYREFLSFSSPWYIFPSFVISEAAITILFLPCFMGIALVKVGYFKKNGKPLEDLNNEVKWLTRMCFYSFAMASFYTILGVSSIYFLLQCGYRCDEADPDLEGRQRNCTYIGYSNNRWCYAHPALLIPFVILSIICMWAAGVIYFVTLIMFFGEDMDGKVHPQGPQEATTVELITPQEQSATTRTSVEQPSSSPIVQPTVNEGSFHPPNPSPSATKGKTTRKPLSKETKYLVLKIMILIVLPIAIALLSACYWLRVPNIYSAKTWTGYLFGVEFVLFAIGFSVMFWMELVRIILTIFKVWKPLGKHFETEKDDQRDNLISSCLFLVIIVINGIISYYDALSCCKTRCVKKCVKHCAMKICENYGSKNVTEEACIKSAEENCHKDKRCDNTAAIKKCICGEICHTLGEVISLHVSSLIAMFAAAMMFLYLYKVLEKNGQLAKPEPKPIEGQASNQNSKPVEQQASVEQSQN